MHIGSEEYVVFRWGFSADHHLMITQLPTLSEESTFIGSADFCVFTLSESRPGLLYFVRLFETRSPVAKAESPDPSGSTSLSTRITGGYHHL